MTPKELLLLADHLKERPVKITFTDGHEEIFKIALVQDKRKEMKMERAVIAVSDDGFHIYAAQIKKLEFINPSHKPQSYE